ncbi:MAG TPA: hypothetical protein ENJ87_07640 [Gammaproteobacteria bacterium]|nr:hypothetical protein [Gammaproteobacteria bacterium]
MAAFFVTGCSSGHYGMSRNGKPMMQAPFGNADDIAYAKTLWHDMDKLGFNARPATLYVGGPPHGAVREVLEGNIDGRRVIVKRNYGGKGVSIKAVQADRSKYLKSITVMAKREAGFDPEDKNWFWVKYKPNGQLHNNPKGMLLAGRVAKGMDKGCIACHKSASGNDMVFIHNKEANAEITKVN